jgi:hypothetical protein
MHQQQENWEVGGGGGQHLFCPVCFPVEMHQKMPVLLADFLQTGDLVWRSGNIFEVVFFCIPGMPSPTPAQSLPMVVCTVKSIDL